jgi:hypothetical protein
MNLVANPSLDISYSTQCAEATVQDFVKICLVFIPSRMFIKPDTKPTNTQFYGSGLPWKFQQFLKQGKASLILRNLKILYHFHRDPHLHTFWASSIQSTHTHIFSSNSTPYRLALRLSEHRYCGSPCGRTDLGQK